MKPIYLKILEWNFINLRSKSKAISPIKNNNVPIMIVANFPKLVKYRGSGLSLERGVTYIEFVD